MACVVHNTAHGVKVSTSFGTFTDRCKGEVCCQRVSRWMRKLLFCIVYAYVIWSHFLSVCHTRNKGACVVKYITWLMDWRCQGLLLPFTGRCEGGGSVEVGVEICCSALCSYRNKIFSSKHFRFLQSRVLGRLYRSFRAVHAL